jgi:hypothetical protein
MKLNNLTGKETVQVYQYNTNSLLITFPPRQDTNAFGTQYSRLKQETPEQNINHKIALGIFPQNIEGHPAYIPYSATHKDTITSLETYNPRLPADKAELDAVRREIAEIKQKQQALQSEVKK